MGNGLYNAEYEHDACGVGMVVNIHGNKKIERNDDFGLRMAALLPRCKPYVTRKNRYALHGTPGRPINIEPAYKKI